MEEILQSVARAADPTAELDERNEAFSYLVKRYWNMALGCALGILSDPASSEDAVQEAFISAWRNIHSLRTPEAFPAWLRRIVVWQCYYIRRSSPPKAQPIDELLDQLPNNIDVSSSYERRDLFDRVWDITTRLSKPHREILTLHYLEEYSTREISGFLDISEGAVRKRLHDARKRTRKAFDQLFGETLRDRLVHDPPPEGVGQMNQHIDDKPYRRSPEEVIERMIRPVNCEATEEGRILWEMYCAAIRNDVETLETLLSEDRNRASFEFWYTAPIYFAVREGNLAATKVLWKAHPDPEVTDLIQTADDRGFTEISDYLRDQIGIRAAQSDLRLHEAVEEGDAEVAIDLLRDNPELAHQRDPEGQTPLHYAAANDIPELVEPLIEAGAEVDAVDYKGFRPIHRTWWRSTLWQPAKGSPEVREKLSNAGAEDSITLAVAREDVDAVRAFLDRDSDLANDGDTLQKRPISVAAQNGNHEIARLLLDHGADPKLPETRANPFGSALMYASVQNDLQMAEWLLEAGADPNGNIDSSGTPTIRANTDEMRGLLYGYGGNAQSIWGYLQRGNLEIAAVILRYSQDPFADDDKEYLRTPYTAIISGCSRAINNGDDPSVFHTLLRLFLKRKYPMPEVLTSCKAYLYMVPEMTAQLLENGLDPNLPDWQRRTPLHNLAGGRRGYEEEQIERFLKHGADINAIEEDALSTPLGTAAGSGSLAHVKLLTERGADPNLSGAPWSTPLAWAQRRGHTEISDFLKQHGANA